MDLSKDFNGFQMISVRISKEPNRHFNHKYRRLGAVFGVECCSSSWWFSQALYMIFTQHQVFQTRILGRFKASEPRFKADLRPPRLHLRPFRASDSLLLACSERRLGQEHQEIEALPSVQRAVLHGLHKPKEATESPGNKASKALKRLFKQPLKAPKGLLDPMSAFLFALSPPAR